MRRFPIAKHRLPSKDKKSCLPISIDLNYKSNKRPDGFFLFPPLQYISSSPHIECMPNRAVNSTLCTRSSPELGKMEIVFFDLETTVPARSEQRKFSVLEFGSILVCPHKLMELDSYTTLVRPDDLSAVPLTSSRCNGITADAVAAAPRFQDVADRIFSILNGRVWAGHNVHRFDSVRIREAFANIGRPAPQPLGVIDSLDILNRTFGQRAGNLKMATLAAYFGLGRQKHRSLDDVRMNLEVLKHCATVLLLESSLPDVLSSSRGIGSSSIITRSKTYEQRMCRDETSRKVPSASNGCQKPVAYIQGESK